MQDDPHHALQEWTRLAAEDTRNVQAQAQCAAELVRWLDAHRACRDSYAVETARAGGVLVARLARLVRLSEDNGAPHELDVKARDVREAGQEFYGWVERVMPLEPARLEALREHWAALVVCHMNLAMHTDRCSLHDALERANLVGTIMRQAFASAD